MSNWVNKKTPNIKHLWSFSPLYHFWISRRKAIHSHFFYESKLDVNEEFTSKFVTGCRSCTFLDDILETNILVRETHMESFFFKSTSKRISRYFVIKSTKCRETRRYSLSQFLHIFQPFISFYCYNDDIYCERKHDVERSKT